MNKEPIAIIGIGCRFPKVISPETFWHLLRDGVDAITEMPPSRWDLDPDTEKLEKINTRWGGFIEQVDHFDPKFFGISSREANNMDPQQRLLLEVTWEALEDAGQIPKHLAGTQTGVFIGISTQDFSVLTWGNSDQDIYMTTGTSHSIAANRISYVFNFTGPSVAFDTACSSSLVAVHYACQSLWNQESTVTVAGGVNLLLLPKVTANFAKAGFMALNGRCKTFDARADGYVRGEGAGVVILKPVSQALADGDPIYAVIKGSAINQDGRSNGLTAPNPQAQEAVVRSAYQLSGISPGQVQYIEAHGTGTSLGDPIEMKALGKVLAQDRLPGNVCAIGSVKTNIGHLEAAAGIAGLIKVALSLKHRQIPPSLHFQQPNPYIPFDKLPLQVQQTLEPWPQGNGLALAGVSSFGFGGTNAHVVLAEAPPEIQSSKFKIQKEDITDRPLHLLTLSAKSEKALGEMVQSYQEFLLKDPNVSLADVCFTANTGRSHFDYRLSIVTKSKVQLQKELSAFTANQDATTVVSGQVKSKKRPQVAFLFTGQGSQYIGMGRQLYETAPIFRRTLDRCDKILRSYLGKSLLKVLYPEPGETSPLDQTAYTQPALFAIEYALFELWKSWGVFPTAVMGHSLGEYVAACVAGVFSLEDGLKLIAERSRLMQSLPPDGEMVVVFAAEDTIRAITEINNEKVAFAAINAPQNTVISGERQAVCSICNALTAKGIKTKKLQVSHAFHSPLMEPMLAEFHQIAASITYAAPQIDLISNLTAERLTLGDITPGYWGRHLRECVQFADSLETLHTDGYEMFVEIGPKPTLLGMGRNCLAEEVGVWLPSLRQGQDDWLQMLQSLGKLYTCGVPVDWSDFDSGYKRELISLPTYPWQRQRYWIQSDNSRDKNIMDVKDSEYALPKPQVDTTPKIMQESSIRSKLLTILAPLLQTRSDEINVHAPFLEMGADSLVLVEAVRAIENTFGIKVAIRQLFEDFKTIDTLATYISQSLPPKVTLAETFEIKPNPSLSPQPSPEVFTFIDAPIHETPEIRERKAVSETAVERIMTRQIEAFTQLISQQLQVLQNNSTSVESGLLSETTQSKTFNQSVPSSQQSQRVSSTDCGNKVDHNKSTVETIEPVIAYQPTQPFAKGALNSPQQQHLEALIARYTKRTQESKRQKQTYQPFLADRRASSGFRLSTKEMLYPIVAERSKGSRFWDVDGNEYIDITMGFGVHLFGHGAPFITEALEKQLKQGIQIGPQSHLAGEVAKLICEMTGMERVTFSQSGSEAVMTALRLARTATGRTKIALFSGSYHGHTDGVLALPEVVDGKLFSVPTALGIPQGMVEDVLVLEYGNPESLDILQDHAQELAAVLVEPVQSRRPNLQPKKFLQQLRQLTTAAGTALIFDEVITGFRIHPGGAQAWFGIEADLTIYGKVLGGGMPLGVVAGKATYMDRIDGGIWKYGDASFPQVESTFFAGTFCKPPIAMTAAHAVLKHLKMHGSTLQQQLNQRTTRLAETLNAYFQQEDVPLDIVHFGSLFRFAFSGNMDLLFYHLIEKGVYVWEGRTCFLSTAHTDDDIEYVIQAVKNSVEEMRAGGFLPGRSPNLPKGEQHIDRAVSFAKSSSSGSATSQQMSHTQTTNVTQVDADHQPGFWERNTYKPALKCRSSTGLRARRDQSQGMSFSLFYFGNYESEFVLDKYNLLFEGAKFADEHGFEALWIPERHFHAFGGFSPNPSVLAAALAKVTQRIQLRAGSVVLPIHHPIRVAEEWSVVDNLSKGRVGLSLASGWHPNDFVFAPESYGNHRELMFQGIETVQKLWRGESIQVRDGAGSNIDVKMYPMPMQPDVPIWITIVNNPDTYIRAGEIGAGVLTNLMGQTVEDLAKNISLYRESLSKHGYDPESGQVTVLLHTFVGDDVDIVREKARQPFYNYLQSSLGLFQNLVKSQGLNMNIDKVTEDDKNYLLSAAYERYVQTSALIGTPSSCTEIIDNLIAIGVDEVACFIDFGMSADSVLEGLLHLNVLRKRYENRENGSHPDPKSALPPTLSAEKVNFDVADIIPLTNAQKQIWLLAQMGSEALSAYNESIMLQLQGSLQLETMRRVFQKVIDRHEALRTTIKSEGDVQQILPTLTIDIPVIDFSTFNPTERETKVDEWLKQASKESFSLTEGPLLRINILKLEPQQHLLLLTVHHIVVDGWSITVLLQEVSMFYSAECQGVDCQQEQPPQFREYVNWQVQQSQSPEIVKQEAYWLGQFADSIPVLELPTDRPRMRVKTNQGARATMKIETNLCAALKKLSRQKGCTLFMMLLANYMVLMHRWTNQDDIVVGIPTAGRTPEGIENMVGYCSNLLPIRSFLVGSAVFSEYLTTIRHILLDAYEHQDYIFANLLKQLNLRRDHSRSPLVSAAFNLERPMAMPQMLGLKLTLVSPPVSYAKFDIFLNVTDINSELLLDVDYNTDLFDAATITRMLEHLQTLLESVVADPEQRLVDLPLLTEAERQQLLVEWNNTQVDYPANRCIHQLFEAQVEQMPDAVAVVFESQQLTYRELNHRANCLAHHLLSLGVKPDSLVGLCVERSLEMVVGLLGILKAGGAYVPLDPVYPQERLSFMLEDAQVPILLTLERLMRVLPDHNARVVQLDTDWETIAQKSEVNLVSGVIYEHLAYVIYTSGSTGKPKGVLLAHQGLVNYCVAVAKEYGLQASDRILQFSSISFDIAVEELFPSWIVGATVILRSDNMLGSSRDFQQVIEQERLTVLSLPTAYWHQWVHSLQSLPQTLRLVVVGGEKVSPTTFSTWRQLAGADCIRWLNTYGPTETTVIATVYEPATDPARQGVTSELPIGRPIANTKIYLLNDQQQLVPIGVPGEVYIDSPGLARGYLNHPGLTAERFIPNPFSQKIGARLYKSGDLARYLPDGNIDYLGRFDQQVKVRGYRIELAEIETVLNQHSAVQESVVLTWEDVPGNKRLVAYVVVNQTPAPTIPELHHFLTAQLPEYMIPSAIVMLESLPLTPNGKVDRRALPSPELHRELSTKYIAPRTPIEEMLMHIWASVLQVERVGIYDNFFELGGHSLLATQLISRIRSSLKVELPLRSVFASATVAQLAQEIQQWQQQQLELTSPPLLAISRNVELPLSFAQSRLWFLDQLKPNSAFYNIPAALRLQGVLKVAALEQSLRETIVRHEVLRTNFITVEGQPVQIIHTETAWTLSIVDWQHLPISEQQIASEQLAITQAQQPFDLANEPLFRATLVVLSDTEHILLVCMHHIISDGWSIGVFIFELAALYDAFCQGQPSPLLPLRIQYADFAQWQRQWLQGDVLQTQLAYWQQQLAKAPALLSLPTDRPREAEQTFSGTHLSFALSGELTTKLTQLSQQQGTTLFMTLLAAFDVLLYRYTSTEDILVGSAIANRNLREVEGLIGFFVNSLVMRTDVSGDPTFGELLGRVREMAIDAYAHQDLPFEMLVEALQPERNLSHTPLFQVMFVLQNAPMPQMELAGLTVSSLPAQSATAKFDLTLSMENTADGLVGVWEYNTDLFNAETIERMAGHLQILLFGIVANPQQPISQLPLLTEVEQEQLLVDWNETTVEYPHDKCIHQLFEEQTKRTPHAVAVVYENQQLTYDELNCRANQLAHYLRSLGVGSEVLVGLCMERSLEMVVGLLGILKAGGAYVPLDPEYPTERLSFMLEDAAVSVLLTQQKLIERLPQHQAQLVCLDTHWLVISQSPQDNPITGGKATNLAYVIYTSGSTGQPKGVEVVHRGVNRLLFGVDYAVLDATQRFLQMSPISFDASTFEIWGALLHGAQCVLYPGNIPTFNELRHQIHKHGITILWLTAALFNSIIDEDSEALSGIEQLLIGGEALSVAHVQKAFETLPFTQIINGYGPTESTTFTCCYPIPRLGETIIQSIPIGRPIANTQIYILDSNLQPVPIGVPGELHIGGAGLAQGYLNRPELTQEKFIPNPFSADEHSRLYKTGDLARYLADGNIEYLGRIDNQVKIRGFRIELGEIEAVLSQHPSVDSVVVTAIANTSGDQRLVAYIVPQNQSAASISDLREFLKTKLPKYMMPSAIVILSALPLTPNGKVDRCALPEPELDRELLNKFVAPRTRIEEMLAHIWASLLKVELVGIHDNFFELGGDSILSIQIISRANQVGIQLSPKQLFMNQTIAELATVVGTTGAIQAEQGLVTGTVSLTPIQHWFFEQNLAQPHHFNQSFLLSVPSEWKPELLEQVVQYLLLHHDALRLRFIKSESDWQQIHAADADNVVFSFVDLSTLTVTDQTTAIERKAAQLQASLDLSKDLVRITFFWLGVDKPSRLLIVIHHLVVDGVSWRILLEDLQTAYQQLCYGKALQLPPKTTSFKDWSYRLAEYAQSEVFKSELAYWLSKSQKLVCFIPVDYVEGVNTVASASTISVSLNQADTIALLQDVPKAYNTQINDVLLTALVQVFRRWTSSNSVLLNLEGHGREDIFEDVDLSRTVGWFTTIFPVLMELGVTDNLGDALKLVKEQLRAIPNKGIGYGLLRYLSKDAETAAKLQALLQAQLSFNYLGQFDQVLNTSSAIQLAIESGGAEHSLHSNRPYLLDINAIIFEDQLQINWTYSTNVHQHTTIESLAQEFVKTLQSLIAHCLAPESGGYTPSDFELVNLSQLELDQVLASIASKQELDKTKWKNLEDIFPLSPMQQGMLFHSLYAPESGVYFEQLSCTFRGDLKVPAFEQAWQQVVARHSVLRTAFVWENLSEPLQVVYRQVKVNVEAHDWRELSVDEQRQQLEVFLQSQRQQGFQLSQAPLIRLNLIQLDYDYYQFIWSFHHLLLDGWSVPLVFKDLLDFYQAFSEGETLRYEPTASYRNYIAWLQKQHLAKAEEFWRQKLKGLIAPTPLMMDRLLSNQQSHVKYSEQQIQLTVQATAGLQSFARQHQLSVNNLVQATWGLLLCRYSGETDVVFGATVSGRPPSLVGIESIVGLFINTLPVRVQISGETELLPLLKDLQAQQVECEQYSYSPLVEIQGWSEIPRGTSLFESIVVFENYPIDVAVQQRNGSLEISSIRGIEQTNYPLTVVALPGEQLSVKISYDTNRFDDATIIRMLGHFQTLLFGIVTNPQQPIFQLPLLTEVEQQQLLVDWNETTVEYPQDKCIHQLFEEQVERTPYAVAVVFENQQLTYSQLNDRANQLAHYLRSLGVGSEVLVGICVERSLEMVVGLLGILKAGGAYVPLDPEYPQERLNFILEDAAISVLLTQQQLIERLPQHQAQLVCFDEVWEQIAQNYQDNPLNAATPDNLAYTIYTSGSTGKPKGVLVNHSNVVRLFEATELWYHFDEQDVWTLFHSYAFDFSIWEIWGALLYGGRLVVVPYLVTRSPESLLELLCQEQVTILNQTPSAFRQLIQVEQSQAIAEDLKLRLIIFGGEALEPKSLQPWFERHGDRSPQLVNMYGITETTVHVTYRPLSKADLNGTASIIGRPIPDLQVYLLDQHLQPVPIGVPGEMYVAGSGVTRGYLNRPELTEQRFISNPFQGSRGAGEQGGRSHLYKTGDLARFLPNGELEYLGRVDQQVKIRGFRIELGEIEVLLAQHPSVWESVVVVRENEPDDKRLVAYVVPKAEQSPTAKQLRHFLANQLPSYMVPNTFVVLESLPLTPNGKVDRRALPEPDTNNLAMQASFVPPLDIVEQRLAEIWAEVLNVYPVGVKDNFFDLGGHSLLAMQIMARIEHQFKKNLPLATLFQNSTIERLATILRQPIDALNWSPLVSIQPNGTKRPFFCVPGVGGNTIYLYNLAHNLGKEQPFFGLQSLGLDGKSKPHTRIEDMAASYIEAIQSVQPSGPYLLGGHSFGGMVAFEMATQLHKQGYEVALLALLDSGVPGCITNELDFDGVDDAGWLNMIASRFESMYAKSLNVSEEALKVLAPDEQLNYFKEQLQRVNLLPPDVGIKQLRALMEVFKTNYQTASVYIPQAVYPSQITFFRASQIDAPSDANSEILEELGLGWDKFSAQPLDIHFVPGDHFTMLSEPHVQVLAQQLTICIERSQADD